MVEYQLESEVANLWIDDKKSNPNTNRQYKQSLGSFEKFLGKDLDEYLVELGFPVEEYLEALNSEGNGRGFFIERDIEDVDLSKFWSDLLGYYEDQSELSPNTRETRLSNVKNFFQRLKIRIPEEEWKNFMQDRENIKGTLTHDKCGTRREWKKVLMEMFPPAKGYYLTLLSSGMRPSELLSVKLEGVHLDLDPPRIRLKPTWSRKIKRRRTTFITQEAAEEIEKYLNWRKGKKKRNGEPWEGDLLFPLDPSTTSRYLKKAKQKVGLDDDKDSDTGRSKLHQYSARKYFNSKCGLDDDLRHRLMGHSEYLSGSYSRQEEGEDAEIYKEIAEPRLTILEKEMPEEVEERLKESREDMLETLEFSLRLQGVPQVKLKNILKGFAERFGVEDYQPKLTTPIVEKDFEVIKGHEEIMKAIEMDDLEEDEIDMEMLDLDDLDLSPEEIKTMGKEERRFNKITDKLKDLRELHNTGQLSDSAYETRKEGLLEEIYEDTDIQEPEKYKSGESETKEIKQKVVDNEDLQEYLDDGWLFESTLGTDKTVVKMKE